MLMRQPLCGVATLAAVCAALTSGCGSGSGMHAVAPVDTTKAPTDTLVALAFDLRFKGVGVLSGLPGGLASGIPGALGQGYTNFSGSPLSIGTGVCAPKTPDRGCALEFTSYPLPAKDTGLTTWYVGNYWENIGGYFQTTLPNDTVITSLDLELGDSLFAYSAYVTSVAGGYGLNVRTVAPNALSAAAAADGAQRRVITALSFLNGQVEYFAYSWQHDTVTAGYDAQVDTASLASVPADAQALAAAGYTITAFGGDSADGFILVGTRVHGVTTPRTLTVVPNSGAGIPGSATVIYLSDGMNGTTVIAER